MTRKKQKEKPRNNGQWTEPRFTQFVMGALRQASKRWGPRALAMSRASVRRGWYLCALCKQEVPASSYSVYKSGAKKGKPKRVKNNQMDHIVPVIDQSVGFESWDKVVTRMFSEVDGWQCICHACHEKVTAEERALRTARERKKREAN